jgi:hypothetical protein
MSSGCFAIDANGVELTVGGFIRADVGVGDRYTDQYGEDFIGISKAALAITTQYEGIEGVFVIGTEAGTNGDATADGNVDIKDAYIVINDFMGGVSLSIGGQPLLFGMKSNGYPGDSSLQSSIEYGAGGAFAVSNQAGPSVIAVWGETLNFRLGFFDQSGYANGVSEGSGWTDNILIEMNYSTDSGIYASAGFETLYRDATENGEPVWHAGLGYKNNSWDLSAEYFALDATVNGTTDDESYAIVELAFHVNPLWTMYVDWSEADQMEISTIRVGNKYKWNNHFFVTAEYAHDEMATGDLDSFDIRFTMEY